ncbi:MAG TPA: NAD(P)/FAD-dependent oxidoreductase [Acidimicrobiia bacterium]
MEQSDESPVFDRDAIRAKYAEEREKRLTGDRAAFRDLAHDDAFARYRDDPFTPVVPRDPVSEDVDVAIIGAGMGGVVAGAQLRKSGVERIRLIDSAGGIGGTWYWNRYPGVMCDVESYTYLPMLEEMGYIPTTRYAFGDEIRRHLENIALKFDLVDSTLFHTSVQRSEWDETTSRWVVRTDRGDEIRAKYLVTAVGILNLMKMPVIPGMEDFAGKAFHSARWDYAYTGGSPTDPHLTKLADKVVGVIGTGASAIQAIPALSESAERVVVFQRTPAAVGVRGNYPTTEDFVRSREPGWQRERMENFQAVMLGLPVETDLVDDGWCHHFGPVNNPKREPGIADDAFARRVEQFDYEIMEEHRRRIEQFVEDPGKVSVLMPYYRYQCRRPLFHDEYLPALNRTNVTVVDCATGIDRISEHGVVVDGKEYEVDCIVYATGFEPEVTPVARRLGHEVVGRGGRTLADKWREGQATLFGMMTRGFPNLFLMPAPGQQAVVTVNFTLVTVVGAEFVAATVAALEEQGVESFEVSEDAEADWGERIVSSAKPALIQDPCTPSFRIENAYIMDPRSGSYGGGLGDYFGYIELLAKWRESGNFPGLELVRS